MRKLTYVTHDYNKYLSLKEKLDEKGISIDYYNYELTDPNINDVSVISRHKAEEAFDRVKSPVIVCNAGFYIEGYPGECGYPGAFIKRSLINSNIDSLLRNMESTNNRNCYFVNCLTFYDGKDYHQFYELIRGVLSTKIRGTKLKKVKPNLWHVFIPEGYNKTLAEMSDAERKILQDERVNAIEHFSDWYNLKYIDIPKVMVKK